MTNIESISKETETLLSNKGPYSQSYGFSSSHVQMWELDHKEDWAPKNWCFQTVVLEKTFESPLDSKEIQPVYPRGNQSWIFIGRADAEAEAAILWPPDMKKRLIGKDPDAGKYWRREKIRSDQISHSVVSLRPHESQHARPPCPSPTPRVHSNSRPSSQWCHPAISASVVPFSSCPQSLPASGSFPMSQLFTWGGQSGA